MEIRRTTHRTTMSVLNLSGKIGGRDEKKLKAETRWCMMTVGRQNTQYDNDGLRAECLLTCLSGYSGSTRPTYSQPFHVPYVCQRMGDAMLTVKPWLTEFSGVLRSCFTLSRCTVFPDVSLIKPEVSINPVFSTVLYSMSWVRKLEQSQLDPPKGTTRPTYRINSIHL